MILLKHSGNFSYCATQQNIKKKKIFLAMSVNDQGTEAGDLYEVKKKNHTDEKS